MGFWDVFPFIFTCIFVFFEHFFSHLVSDIELGKILIIVSLNIVFIPFHLFFGTSAVNTLYFVLFHSSWVQFFSQFYFFPWFSFAEVSELVLSNSIFPQFFSVYRAHQWHSSCLSQCFSTLILFYSFFDLLFLHSLIYCCMVHTF